MSDEQKSWWHTLPGVLTAAAGFLTAIATLYTVVNRSGGSEGSPDSVQAASGAGLPPSEGPKTEGWGIVGAYRGAKLAEPYLKVDGDMPAKGGRYEVIKPFRLLQGDPRERRGSPVITLGQVREGEMVDVLDVYIDDGSNRSVHAKLRAVLKPH